MSWWQQSLLVGVLMVGWTRMVNPAVHPLEAFITGFWSVAGVYMLHWLRERYPLR